MASAKQTLQPVKCRSCLATFSMPGAPPQRWHRHRQHPTSTFPFGSVAVTHADFHPAETIKRYGESELCEFCFKHKKTS